jgi:hypothetical protein
MESAVLEMVWTAERNETRMVCKEGTMEELAVERKGESGAFQALAVS